jgi:hypothetical protein
MAVVAILGVIAIVLIIITVLSPAPVVCPKELRRNAHGELRLHPTKRMFPDMNAFQNWWYATGLNTKCPLPILVEPTKVLEMADHTEQTYAKTPINKVDDYEFSRVFGTERNGQMVIDQDYNKILLARNTDWSNRPVSSDERKDAYRGLHEGFTTQGELDSKADAISQYGALEVEEDCKLSQNVKKVTRLVEKVYEDDKDWEPVVVQVGANNWEVNELKPRYRATETEVDTVVDTKNPTVKLSYRYPDQEVLDAATDPYYLNGGWQDPREYKDAKGDPYRGVVPNMARMFGPTVDTQDWLNTQN